jgi:DNA-binding MarR family transcriptional regulator
VERTPCVEDKRATNARLTEAGFAKVVQTAPGHVATVRQNVIDPLTAEDVADLDRVMGRILDTLDPEHRFNPAARE